MKFGSAVLSGCVGVAALEKSCRDYYGDVSGLVTVVDTELGVPGKTDGSGQYCDANNVARPCSFIHYAGLKTECAIPAPPDATHRYHKVRYSHHCRKVLSNMNLTYQIDVDHVFDSQGVLKQCANYVIGHDEYCISPPEDDPKVVPCDMQLAEQPTTTTTTVAKTCEDYFGDVSGVVTVVDPTLGVPGKTDASGEYCDANNVSRPCSFIHYAGLETECRNPGPPDATHRYHKVTYSHECRRVLERMNLTWQVDVENVFDSKGVLKQCADYVLKNDVSCWAPPAEDPQSAACDELDLEQPATTTLAKTCEDYFGDVSGVVTVVDPTLGVPGKTDASGEYCDANNVSRPCSFIHYAGLETECRNPGPPDATHRYHKVTYSHECRRVLERMNLTWQVDVENVFDSQGVLKECADYVVRIDVSCWAPPAEDPQSAACDVEGTGNLLLV